MTPWLLLGILVTGCPGSEDESAVSSALPPVLRDTTGAEFEVVDGSVPCCLPDDSCGRRRAYMTDPTDCAAPAQPDPDCPDMMTMGFGGMGMTPMDGGTGGMVMEGCCAPSKLCGVISGADGSCITSSTLLPNLMPGAPCGDDMDGGSE